MNPNQQISNQPQPQQPKLTLPNPPTAQTSSPYNANVPLIRNNSGRNHLRTLTVLVVISIVLSLSSLALSAYPYLVLSNIGFSSGSYQENTQQLTGSVGETVKLGDHEFKVISVERTKIDNYLGSPMPQDGLKILVNIKNTSDKQLQVYPGLQIAFDSGEIKYAEATLGGELDGDKLLPQALAPNAEASGYLIVRNVSESQKPKSIFLEHLSYYDAEELNSTKYQVTINL